MITIFAIPKAFRGQFDVIQRNAIQSWTLLRPPCEVILFGDDEGTAEVADEFGLRHIPDVARNEFGTPLVSFLFETAQEIGRYDLLAYVNADIILMSDFVDAVRRMHERPFLMVGHRWDLDVHEPLDFTDLEWQANLRLRAKESGCQHGRHGIDYFVFPRGLFMEMPPLAVGRSGWDNWMLYNARGKGVALIDATASVMVVHQNHDFSHHPQGFVGAHTGPEAKRNVELAGGPLNMYDLHDATWLLTSSGLRPALRPEHIRQRLLRLTILHPQLRAWARKIRSGKQR